MPIKYVTGSKLPTIFGLFDVHCFEEENTGKEHLVLSMGELIGNTAVITRIHSECLTGDALFSLRCDCGAQLKTSLQYIAEQGSGLILYLRQEGRGIGLLNKIKAYKLQDEGLDTVQANEKLGFKPDLRRYDICADILDFFKVNKIRLMTNNPAKIEALTKLGIKVTERISIQTEQNLHNESYLETKACKLGHVYDD